MKKLLIDEIEEFIDKLIDEWTINEIKIEVKPKYGNELTVLKRAIVKEE